MGSCFRLVCFSLLFVFVLAWAGWPSLASCFFFFFLVWSFFFFGWEGFFFWAVELDLIAEATREGGRGGGGGGHRSEEGRAFWLPACLSSSLRYVVCQCACIGQ